MTIASTLSGLLSVKHPSLKLLCREDGAVLVKKLGSNRSNNIVYHYTFGFKANDGYKRVGINGKQYAVHRLIAEAFLYANSDRTFVDHINRIRNDNRVSNLRWVTFKENMDNSSTVINRDTRVTVRCCENKQAYYRIASSFRLHIVSLDGKQRTTRMLPKDVYDKLKPMTQLERYYAYQKWIESNNY